MPLGTLCGVGCCVSLLHVCVASCHRIKQEIDVLVNPTSRGRGAAMQAAAAHASDPRMLPFPRSVQEARKIIQREAAAFSEPPVGPVGRYLSVQGDDSHL